MLKTVYINMSIFFQNSTCNCPSAFLQQTYILCEKNMFPTCDVYVYAAHKFTDYIKNSYMDSLYLKIVKSLNIVSLTFIDVVTWF